MKRRIQIVGWLTLSLGAAALAGSAASRSGDVLPPDQLDTEALWTVPAGLPDIVPGSEDTPEERRRVALGRRLFFDPILSAERNRSCASCHQPEHGFASPEPRPSGRSGGELPHNAPTLFNRAFGAHQMWDGRFETLEQQALMPIENEEELGLPIDEALERLRGHDDYPALFREAFDAPPDEDTLARAIAAFVRRILHGGTAMDEFRAGKVLTLTTDERAGMWIFQSKAQCWRCHHGFNFTDEQFHNTGVGVIDGTPEPGRMAVTGDETDAGAFKTPTLRALLDTAPYFHDGSAATLRDVVEFYNRGGEANAHLDPVIHPLELSDQEIDLLVAFLGSLTRRAED